MSGETKTTTRMKRFVGSCKKCKTGAALDVQETVTTTTGTYRTPQGFEMVRTTYRYAYNQAGYGSYSESLKIVSTVAGCGHKVALKRVQGVVTDHVCNAKCMSSTGPVCECSCGGKNHGAGHLLVLA